MVGERGCTRLDDAAAAADDRRPGRGVVRGAERRIEHERLAGRQRSRHGMDRADLKRRRWLESRQNGRNPLCQHRLPAAWRAEQHQVMTARGADLGGPPGDWLTDQVGQVLGDHLVGRRGH